MDTTKSISYKIFAHRKSKSSSSLLNRQLKSFRSYQLKLLEDGETKSVMETSNGIINKKEESNGDQLETASRLNTDGSFPPSYLILKLSPNIQPAAVNWLASKITGKKQEGGAELLLRCEPFSGKKRESLVLHVSASKLKFLEVAEYIELKKTDKNNVLREFTVADLDAFLYDDVHLDNLLTAAEKQTIVLHELENMRAQFDNTCVPGYPTLSLFPGQSILQVYLQEALVTTYFPLHDELELSQLGAKWYWAFVQPQPFEEIRKYFGESIALYFSFLGYYTTSLFAPTILGILHMFLPETASSASMAFFCVFNLLWVTIFLEVWKRKCSELAYVWGTLRMTKWDEPTANYRGKMSIDPVTGRYQAKYPWWKTVLKVYCVSLPIVLVCLLGGKYMYLTEWENHRTQAQFDRNRVTKLVLFEFVNNFMSLFHIAFYIQDFEMLKSQVTVMLIIMQGINHFQEALLPLVIKKGYSKFRDYIRIRFPWTNRIFNDGEGRDMNKSKRPADNNNHSEFNTSIWSPNNLGLVPLDPNDPRIERSTVEGEMDPYEASGNIIKYETTEVFDDYLELFVQFGYVFLFSAVYPLAAFWAILNNLLEIRADAFKLCKVFQRPIPRRVKDIGAWQVAFEVMGGIAVMTNCALLSLSPNLRSWAPDMKPAEWLLLFVVIEHFLLALKLALRQLIPDTPSSVKIALARLEYQSRQALKNEQVFKARRQLTRRFKTIHVARNKKNLSKTSINSSSATQSPLGVIKRKVNPVST